MTLVHTPSILCSGISVELENTVRVFLISVVLESLGRLSQAKCLVTTASALPFQKEVTKGGLVEDQKDLGVLYASLFFTQMLKTTGNPAGY